MNNYLAQYWRKKTQWWLAVPYLLSVGVGLCLPLWQIQFEIKLLAVTGFLVGTSIIWRRFANRAVALDICIVCIAVGSLIKLQYS